MTEFLDADIDAMTGDAVQTPSELFGASFEAEPVPAAVAAVAAAAAASEKSTSSASSAADAKPEEAKEEEPTEKKKKKNKEETKKKNKKEEEEKKNKKDTKKKNKKKHKESSSSSSSSASSSSSSSSSSEHEKKKKKSKTKKRHGARGVDADELAMLHEDAKRVTEMARSLAKTVPSDVFDHHALKKERRSAGLHGSEDKLPELMHKAALKASQRPNANGRPTRVAGQIAKGYVEATKIGEIAAEILTERHGASSKKHKHAKRHHHHGSDEVDEDGKRIEYDSLGSEDSDRSEGSDSYTGSFVASDDGDGDANNSADEAGSGESSDSISSSASSSSVSSSSATRKKKKHTTKKAEKKIKRKVTKLLSSSSESSAEDELPAPAVVAPKPVPVSAAPMPSFGFIDTHQGKMVDTVRSRVVPLFMPTLEATIAVCASESKGIATWLKAQEALYDKGKTPFEVETRQSAARLGFLLPSLDPNPARHVSKAFDIAGAAATRLDGPVPALLGYPSNSTQRTLVNAIKGDFMAESDAVMQLFAGIFAAARAGETPLAHLVRHLAHARNVTFLAQKPMPANLKRAYTCPLSGSTINAGESVNIYRVTKRGPWEGDSWFAERPWESDHVRPYSGLVITRAHLTGMLVPIPFTKPAPADLAVAVSPTPKRAREDTEEPVTAAAPMKRQTLSTAPVPRAAPVLVDATPDPKRTVSQASLEAAPKPAKKSKTAEVAREKEPEQSEAGVYYVKLHPIKDKAYTGDKVLAVDSFFGYLDAERAGMMLHTRTHAPASTGDPFEELFAAAEPPGLTDARRAELLAVVTALRNAKGPNEIVAAIKLGNFSPVALQYIMAVAQMLVVDEPTASAKGGATASIEALFTDDTTADTRSQPAVLAAPIGMNIRLGVWGLAQYMNELMLKKSAGQESPIIKTTREARRIIAEEARRGITDPKNLPAEFVANLEAIVCLIEAGLPA